jgi:hypothetical protein
MRRKGRQQIKRRVGVGNLLAHMKITFGGADVVMPHQFFDRANVDAGFEQMGGERMPAMRRVA